MTPRISPGSTSRLSFFCLWQLLSSIHIASAESQNIAILVIKRI
uniref:Uncharacterized protein n=1 Tax=Rhizophora mucronata TaxID=61149 RepID=A0A2P2N6F5_RHIMU